MNPRVVFYDTEHGERLPGIETVIPKLDERFDYVWNPNMNRDELKIELGNAFLLVGHFNIGGDFKPEKLLVELAPINPFLRYAQIRGGGDISYSRSSMKLLSQIAELEDNVEFVKPILEDRASHIDHFWSGLPDSMMLREAIAESFLKYQAEVARFSKTP